MPASPLVKLILVSSALKNVTVTRNKRPQWRSLDGEFSSGGLVGGPCIGKVKPKCIFNFCMASFGALGRILFDLPIV